MGVTVDKISTKLSGGRVGKGDVGVGLGKDEGSSDAAIDGTPEGRREAFSDGESVGEADAVAEGRDDGT